VEIVKSAVDVGILVRDADACLKFYCDGLGLQKVGEATFPGNRVQHRLLAGEALIKLMHAPDGGPPAGPAGLGAQSGIRYFTISVRNLKDTVAELEAKGLKIAVPYREVRPGVHIAMLEDPEGNTVELLEQDA
jgi:glyoxylase I family protein